MLGPLALLQPFLQREQLECGYNFEIAVRDILPGEQLTDDYGSFNMRESFACLCGEPLCRGQVLPDDSVRMAPLWDASVKEAIPLIPTVQQPLWPLLKEKAEIQAMLAGLSVMRSSAYHRARR